MTSYAKNDTKTDRINDISSQKELINSNVARKLLRAHDYDPKPLYIENGSLINIHDLDNYAVDDIIYTKEISRNDALNIKEQQPSNRDGIYYSIDYRSNNFDSLNKDNDNVVFVKLMQFFRFYKMPLNEETLLKKQEDGIDIRIKGILSKDNPDYSLYVRHTGDKLRDKMPENSLINAYFLPVKPLRQQIISNLNQIRSETNEKALKFNKSNVNSILSMHQTWELYNEINPEDYNFEIIKIKDLTNGKFDIMMKINQDYLKKYIKFDKKGNIVKK